MNTSDAGTKNDCRHALHAKKLSDAQIAAIEGSDIACIRKWRARQRLAPNPPERSAATPRGPAIDRAIEQNYLAGLNDHANARALGIARGQVQSWRRRFDKPPNVEREHVDDEKRLRVEDAIRSGGSDVAIGKSCGVSPKTVSAYRKRIGLAFPDRQETLANLGARALINYQSGANDIENARLLGVDPSSVRRWRVRSNLPPANGSKRTPPLRQAINPRQLSPLYAAADKAVPRSVPRDIRDDIISDLIVAVLEEQIEQGDIAVHAKRIIGRNYRAWANSYGHRSLDQIMDNGAEGFTMHELLADPKQEADLRVVELTVLAHRIKSEAGPTAERARRSPHPRQF